MAARHAGATRFRYYGPGGEKYVPVARALMGALFERLTIGAGAARMRGETPTFTGQQTQKLPDGTIIRAIWDGAVPVAEIYTKGAKPEVLCDAVPDIIGLAVTPWKKDAFDFDMASELVDTNYTNVYTHAAIAGWKTHRPPTDLEMPEDNKRAWFDSTGEHYTEPRRFFDKTASECGENVKVHEHILMGNWDWTNGTDTLTCFAGTEYTIRPAGAPVYRAYRYDRRYGSRGLDNRIFLRGRLLFTANTGFVIGMALNHSDNGTFLYLITVNGFFNTLVKVPIKWPANKLHPEAGEPETLHSLSLDPGPNYTVDTMWCWNQSGTEARRIRNGIEEQFTPAGYSVIGSATSGDFRTVGNTQVKYGYYVLTGEYIRDNPDPMPLPPPLHWGRFSLFTGSSPRYPEKERRRLGLSEGLSGNGMRVEKIAVDFRNDVPEYLSLEVSGGLKNSSESTTVTPVRLEEALGTPVLREYWREYTTSFTGTRTFAAAQTRVLTTSFGAIATISESGTVANSANTAYTQHDVELLGGTGSNGTVQLTGSSSSATTIHRQAAELLYSDLRSGLFVLVTTETNSVASVSNSFNIYNYGENTGTSVPIDIWEPNEVTVTTSTTGSSEGTCRVLFEGAELVSFPVAFEAIETPPSSATVPAWNYVAEDYRTANFIRLYDAIADYAYAYLAANLDGGAIGPPWSGTQEEYWDSPTAVYYDSPLLGFTNANVDQVFGSYIYPVALTQLADFSVPMIPTPMRGNAPFLVYFGAAADDDGNLYLSMPLPIDGWSEPWVVVNIFQGEQTIPEIVRTPDTFNFYPMSFIGPSFVSAPTED